MLLSTKPGLMSVSATPDCASSAVIELASARRANLLMAYADTPGIATQPATLPVITSCPCVRVTSGSAAYSVRSTPNTLVSSWRR